MGEKIQPTSPNIQELSQLLGEENNSAKGIEPVRVMPENTGVDSEAIKSLFDREIKKQSEKSSSVASVKATKAKKPHNNYGYMGAGAAGMIVGAGILSMVPPVAVIGIPLFVMGLMAYAYAFCNFGEGGGAPAGDHNKQLQDDDKRKKDKNSKEERDAGSVSNNRADGRFIAQPVDFSGGQITPPQGQQPMAQPPSFPPGYSGPHWQDIYNIATGCGIAPNVANNFMNGFLQHLHNQAVAPENQEPNMMRFFNMPLANHFAHSHMQSTGSNTLPQIAGMGHNIPASVEDFVGPVQPTVDTEPPCIVINNINEVNGKTEEQKLTLPLGMNALLQHPDAKHSQSDLQEITDSVCAAWDESLRKTYGEESVSGQHFDRT